MEKKSMPSPDFNQLTYLVKTRKNYNLKDIYLKPFQNNNVIQQPNQEQQFRIYKFQKNSQRKLPSFKYRNKQRNQNTTQPYFAQTIEQAQHKSQNNPKQKSYKSISEDSHVQKILQKKQPKKNIHLKPLQNTAKNYLEKIETAERAFKQSQNDRYQEQYYRNIKKISPQSKKYYQTSKKQIKDAFRTNNYSHHNKHSSNSFSNSFHQKLKSRKQQFRENKEKYQNSSKIINDKKINNKMFNDRQFPNHPLYIQSNQGNYQPTCFSLEHLNFPQNDFHKFIDQNSTGESSMIGIQKKFNSKINEIKQQPKLENRLSFMKKNNPSISSKMNQNLYEPSIQNKHKQSSQSNISQGQSTQEERKKNLLNLVQKKQFKRNHIDFHRSLDTYPNKQSFEKLTYLRVGPVAPESYPLPQKNLYTPESLKTLITNYAPIKQQFVEQDFQIKRYKNGMYLGQLNQQLQRHGKGILFYNNGKKFEGNFQNDCKQGQGMQIYPTGAYYQGNFQKGRKHGKGRFIWSNGQQYIGQWVNGLKHGSGMWKGIKGDSYIGQWVKGKVQGFGVHTWANGDRFQGEFINGLKHGHGTERFANGDVYVGNFCRGKSDGLGQYYWKNGAKYTGDFANGVKHGKGSYKHNNIFYIGQYKNDKKCGQGQQKNKNGDLFIGNFQNDLWQIQLTRHGYGELVYGISKKKFVGYFLNGKPIGSNNQVTQKKLLQSIDQENQYIPKKKNKPKRKTKFLKKGEGNKIVHRSISPIKTALGRRRCQCCKP